jgi:hypothetical protein
MMIIVWSKHVAIVNPINLLGLKNARVCVIIYTQLYGYI